MNQPFHGLGLQEGELRECEPVYLTPGRGGASKPNRQLTPEGRARSPSLFEPKGHPSLKTFGTLPSTLLVLLDFSSILRTTIYCKSIHNHFPLFINQIKTNKSKHKKIFSYLGITSSWEPMKTPQKQAWFSSKAQSGPFCNVRHA